MFFHSFFSIVYMYRMNRCIKYWQFACCGPNAHFSQLASGLHGPALHSDLYTNVSSGIAASARRLFLEGVLGVESTTLEWWVCRITLQAKFSNQGKFIQLRCDNDRWPLNISVTAWKTVKDGKYSLNVTPFPDPKKIDKIYWGPKIILPKSRLVLKKNCFRIVVCHKPFTEDDQHCQFMKWQSTKMKIPQKIYIKRRPIHLHLGIDYCSKCNR